MKNRDLALSAYGAATRATGIGVSDWLGEGSEGEGSDNKAHEIFHGDTPFGAIAHELTRGESQKVKEWFEGLKNPSAIEMALGGWAYLNLDEPHSAVKQLERAVKGCFCHGVLAAAYHQLRMDGLAKQVLAKGRAVVADAPLEFQIFWHRENAEQIYRESPQRSIPFFTHAHHLASQDARTQPFIPGIAVLQAAVYSRLGYDYDAFRVASQALNFTKPSSQRYSQLLYRMLVSQLNLGSLKKASKIVDRISANIDPKNNHLIAYALGRFYLAVGDYSLAQEYLLVATESRQAEEAFYAHLYLSDLAHADNYPNVAATASARHLERARGILILNPNERMAAHLALHEAKLSGSQKHPEAPIMARAALGLVAQSCTKSDLANAELVYANALCVGSTVLPESTLSALARADEARQGNSIATTLATCRNFINLAYEQFFDGGETPKIAAKLLNFFVKNHEIALTLAEKTWDMKHKNMVSEMQSAYVAKDYAAVLALYKPEPHPRYFRGFYSEMLDTLAAIAYCKFGKLSMAASLLRKPNATSLKKTAILELAEAKSKLTSQQVELFYLEQNIDMQSRVAEIKLFVSSLVLEMVLEFGKESGHYRFCSANFHVEKPSQLVLFDVLSDETRCISVKGWDFAHFSQLVAFFGS